VADKPKQHGVNEEKLLALAFTREEQPDGSYKWYAIHPDTKERVEIDPEQAWFWTEEWQEGERKVDEYLRRGEYEEFDNIDDFIDSLL
jgi:hypothetical protein